MANTIIETKKYPESIRNNLIGFCKNRVFDNWALPAKASQSKKPKVIASVNSSNPSILTSS